MGKWGWGSKGRREVSSHGVLSPLPSPGSLEHWAVLSSGMEPEAALWGPDLQGPELSPDDAHRGEGHKKGLRS